MKYLLLSLVLLAGCSTGIHTDNSCPRWVEVVPQTSDPGGGMLRGMRVARPKYAQDKYRFLRTDRINCIEINNDGVVFTIVDGETEILKPGEWEKIK